MQFYRGWKMDSYFWRGVGWCGSIEHNESGEHYDYEYYDGEKQLRLAMIRDIDKLEGVPTIAGSPRA